MINKTNQTQQKLLRQSAKSLGLTQKELATRLRVSFSTLEKWLLPVESSCSRVMPAAAHSLLQEVKEHEDLKKKYAKLMEK